MKDADYKLKVEQHGRWEAYLREVAAKKPPRTSVLPPVPLVWPEHTGDLRHAMAVRRTVVFHRRYNRRERVIRWIRRHLLRKTNGPSF